MPQPPQNLQNVIFEYQRFGSLVRVSAMHTPSLTEVVIQCPAGTPEQQMRAVAQRKLQYVMNKKSKR